MYLQDCSALQLASFLTFCLPYLINETAKRRNPTFVQFATDTPMIYIEEAPSCFPQALISESGQTIGSNQFSPVQNALSQNLITVDI